jgi:hypothetical protein
MKMDFVKIVLAAVLLCSAFPFGAFASEEETAAVILPYDGYAHAGMRWRCHAEGDGELAEISMGEYEKMTGRGESVMTSDGETYEIYDPVLTPGNMGFFFKGERPGETVLSFTLATAKGWLENSPELSAVYKFRVNSDLTIDELERSDLITNK